jgi:hypothetical protein
MSLLDKATYAPLTDGIYSARLVGFETKQSSPDKPEYLSVELSVVLEDGNRPLNVALFNRSIEFFINSMQRNCPMNGASARELLSTVRDSGLIFDITISHKDGYRNVDFFRREQTVSTDEVTSADVASTIPL